MALDQNRFTALQRLSEDQGRMITPEEWVGAGGDWQEYHKLYNTAPLTAPVQGVNFDLLDQMIAQSSKAGQMITQDQATSAGLPAELYKYLYNNASTAGKEYQPNMGLSSTDVTQVKPSGTETAATPTDTISDFIGEDFSGNAAAADKLFTSLMPLLTINPSLTDEQQRAVVASEDASTQAKTAFDPALASAQEAAQRASWVDPASLNALRLMEQEYNTSRNVDPRMEEYLTALKSKADQGLMAPELTAMREESLGGINNQLQTGLRQLATRAGVNGVQGGAAGIGSEALLRDMLQSRADLERKILLENIGYKDTNLNAWGTGVGALDAEKYKRAQETLGNYGSFGNKMWTDQQKALADANTAWGNIATQGTGAYTTAAKNFWDTANNAGSIVDAKNLFNIGQKEKYATGRMGAITGGAEWGSSEATNAKTREYIDAMIAAAQAGGGEGEGEEEGGYEGSSGSSWDDYAGSGAGGTGIIKVPGY
jgi:hypothetical protein